MDSTHHAPNGVASMHADCAQCRKRIVDNLYVRPRMRIITRCRS
ncbi:hypothetical protein C7S15_2741 [Burkholderia cepacia]|nr:hypothetical protein [Burkholderia cepacia]